LRRAGAAAMLFAYVMVVTRGIEDPLDYAALAETAERIEQGMPEVTGEGKDVVKSMHIEKDAWAKAKRRLLKLGAKGREALAGLEDAERAAFLKGYHSGFDQASAEVKKTANVTARKTIAKEAAAEKTHNVTALKKKVATKGKAVVSCVQDGCPTGQCRNAAGYCNPQDFPRCDGMWVRENNNPAFKAMMEKTMWWLGQVMDFYGTLICKGSRELPLSNKCCSTLLQADSDAMSKGVDIKGIVFKAFKRHEKDHSHGLKWHPGEYKSNLFGPANGAAYMMIQNYQDVVQYLAYEERKLKRKYGAVNGTNKEWEVCKARVGTVKRWVPELETEELTSVTCKEVEWFLGKSPLETERIPALGNLKKELPFQCGSQIKAEKAKCSQDHFVYEAKTQRCGCFRPGIDSSNCAKGGASNVYRFVPGETYKEDMSNSEWKCRNLRGRQGRFDRALDKVKSNLRPDQPLYRTSEEEARQGSSEVPKLRAKPAMEFLRSHAGENGQCADTEIRQYLETSCRISKHAAEKGCSKKQRLSRPVDDPYCWLWGPDPQGSRPTREEDLGEAMETGWGRRRRRRRRRKSWGFSSIVKRAKRLTGKIKKAVTVGGGRTLKKMALKLVPELFRSAVRAFFETKGSKAKRLKAAMSAGLKDKLVMRKIHGTLKQKLDCSLQWIIPYVMYRLADFSNPDSKLLNRGVPTLMGTLAGILKDITKDHHFPISLRDKLVRKMFGKFTSLVRWDCMCKNVLNVVFSNQALHRVSLSMNPKSGARCEMADRTSPTHKHGPFGPLRMKIEKIRRPPTFGHFKRVFNTRDIGFAAKDLFCQMTFEYDYFVCRDSPKWRSFLDLNKGISHIAKGARNCTYPYKPEDQKVFTDDSVTSLKLGKSVWYDLLPPKAIAGSYTLYPGTMPTVYPQVCGPPGFGVQSSFVVKPVNSDCSVCTVGAHTVWPKKKEEELWVKAERGQCKAWFSILDSSIRGIFATFASSMGLRGTSECMRDDMGGLKAYCLAVWKDWDKIGKKGSDGKISIPADQRKFWEPFKSWCDVAKEENRIQVSVESETPSLLSLLGDAVGQGRRGGRSFGSQSSFSFGGGNRAGNSELMLNS